ncbi:hypothetical protein FKM82_019919 [Ascaphus truei]
MSALLPGSLALRAEVTQTIPNEGGSDGSCFPVEGGSLSAVSMVTGTFVSGRLTCPGGDVTAGCLLKEDGGDRGYADPTCSLTCYPENQ